MSICAIIISYHPDNEIIENVKALFNQVDEVIIVDNGSGFSTSILLDSIVKQHPKVSVIYLPENLGIATALNIGAKKAKANGYEWIITFDQDSQATPCMIETMLQAYDKYPQKEKVSSLSPRYKDKETGVIRSSQLIAPLLETLPYAEALEAMTSGNLLKLSVFDSVGFFNEALFIDCVDYEYCLRCISQGYKILEVNNAVLMHSVGFPVQHQLLWRIVTANNHSAIRRYYFARNSVYIYKRFAFKKPLLIKKNACDLVKMIIIVMLFEADRKKKLTAIFRGLIDGLFGRMGKCNASL